MLSQTTTHTSLLARLADGSDRSAWDEFHERYGELIQRFARSRGIQPADCDDVAQNVLLALTRALPTFEYDPAKGSFRAYLKATTLRAVARLQRQKQPGGRLADIEDNLDLAVADTDAEATWEAEWRAYHVRHALRLLESEFRAAELRAFQRYAIEGREARETAAALQMTVNQVYQAKSRIMKRLTELVQQQVQDEG
jgi:RNA polymerase sigma-70 factor (ECF subfamily)